MNTLKDIWGVHPCAVRTRWRLLAWCVEHRPGDDLDKALARIAPRLGLDPANRDELRLKLQQQSEAECDCADLSMQLGLDELSVVFGLSKGEQRLLTILLQIELDSEFNDWLSQLSDVIGPGWHVHMRVLASLAEMPDRAVSRLLSSHALLIKTGLISSYRQARMSLSDRYDVRDALIEYCVDTPHDLQHVCASYFTTCVAGQLGLGDYPHMAPSIDRIRGVLRSRGAGTHILLYGPPGTGKTELAHALAVALGLKLYAVPCQDEYGDPIEHQQRLTAFAQAQLVLSARADALLLFDEVEDVIRSSNVSRDGKHRAVSYKGWLHEQLETAPLPSIWISNSLACFDAAQLRRFACIAEVTVPGLRQRRALVAAATDEFGLDASMLEGISRRTDLAPAELHAASREASRCGGSGKAFKDALDVRLRASGRPRLKPSPSGQYNLDFVNTDVPLKPLTAELRRFPSARVLMSGPPGSGKTALALHMAELLEKPLLLKRASDLLSMWVGETEQNLAEAFDEANRDDAVLLLDEADSFLLARHAGQRSWELSQVNELLKQLEDFDGLFFAATNLPELLDPAARRRFDFKLRFDWLALPNRIAMIGDFLTLHCARRSLARAEFERRVQRLPYVLPGDLAAIKRRSLAAGAELLDAQVLEWLSADHALKPEAQGSIGFVNAVGA